jgi:hypothetical protein
MIDEHSDKEQIDNERRDAMKALAKYSAAVGGAAIVVMSAKQALSAPDTSGPGNGGGGSQCAKANPPPWCP